MVASNVVDVLYFLLLDVNAKQHPTGSRHRNTKPTCLGSHLSQILRKIHTAQLRTQNDVIASRNSAYSFFLVSRKFGSTEKINIFSTNVTL